MKRILFLIFILLVFKLSSQCSYTVIASYTPATCPTCCNGVISASLTGTGQTCAPITWRLDPIFSYTSVPNWSNLCPGTYTVVRVDGGCCQVTCQVNLTFTQTGISQNVTQKSYLTYNDNENLINSFIESANSEIKIFDLNGRTIKESKLEIGINKIETKDLICGIYLVVLFVDNRPQKQLKIIRP